ncbi:MAG TPA: hypothetical protein VM529_18035 [Gemmata sp.]|nr:hypothetical protein [Gemmata sp.]
MNTISVMAHGSPGSFVRRVQENPALAVELLRRLKWYVEHDAASESGAEYVARKRRDAEVVRAAESGGGDFEVGDRVVCVMPGSWCHGLCGTVAACGVQAPDGQTGYAVQLDSGGTTVLPVSELDAVFLRTELAALRLILDDPHGCPFCDSGRARNSAKPCLSSCGFRAAREAMAAAIPEPHP